MRPGTTRKNKLAREASKILNVLLHFGKVVSKCMVAVHNIFGATGRIKGGTVLTHKSLVIHNRGTFAS